jgi:D-alanyl-lipoteichoic acid acyltransferase DltB (MBOAT superfamily)
LKAVYAIIIAIGVSFTFSILHSNSLKEVRIHAISFTEDDNGFEGISKGAVAVPIQFGGQSLRALKLGFGNSGEILNLRLDIHADRKDFEVYDQTFHAIPFSCVQRPQYLKCTADVRLGNLERNLTLLSKESTTLLSIDARLQSSKRQVDIGNIPIVTALGLLTLLAPAFWRSSQKTSELLICIATGVWLTAVSWEFFIATSAIMVLFFFLLKRIIERPAEKHYLHISFVAILSILLAEKAVVPLAGKIITGSHNALLLPLGFSYFLIRAVDVTSKSSNRQIRDLSLLEFLSYMFFTPVVAAGPIMTLLDFRQSRHSYTSFESRVIGLGRMAIGILKKTTADFIYVFVVQRYMNVGFNESNPKYLIIVLFGSALFVYLDFSAYSDIAIGLARWWGWKVPENFNYPFFKTSLRSFWRSWHMSLTDWVTRHVFMPASMEVRRSSTLIRRVVPTLGTLLAIGLWHGLEFVWVLWAFHHSFGIMVGDLWAQRRFLKTETGLSIFNSWILRKARMVFGMLLVLTWFALGQVFTLTSSTSDALRRYLTMITLGAL